MGSFLEIMDKVEPKEISFIGNAKYPIPIHDDELNAIGQPIQTVAIALGLMFLLALATPIALDITKTSVAKHFVSFNYS